MARKFARIAEKIVSQSLINAPVDPKKKAKAEDKIREAIEKDERMKGVRKFMEFWNEHRLRYLNLDPIWPKNKGQLTMIENSIIFAQELGLKLYILIGCIHKMYEKRRVRPGYNAIILYGEDAYDHFHDAVLSDLDREEYEEQAAMRRRE